VASLLFGGMGKIYATGSISDAKNAKAELEKKKKEITAKIEALEKEKDDILVYVEKLDKQLSELEEEIEETNVRLSETEGTLEVTRQELSVAKAEEEKQYEAMKLRIKYMYENGSADYLELLVKADNFSDFLNRTEYIAKISEYDKKMYDRHKEIKEQVEKKEAELETQVDELENIRAELAYEEESVQKLRADKQAEVERYENNISLASEEVEKYNEQIAEAEKQIEDLLAAERRRIEEEERAKQAAASGGSNDSVTVDNTAAGFRWPLNVSGRISSNFGGRTSPTAGASTNHKGVDIAVPTGTTIVAAAAGTVVTATYSSSAGNYVMIYHGNSTYTVYMHCSKLNVSVNDKVTKGQKIAEAGSTGISTGSHLHFGVSVNGSYVNPLNYVSQP
jgi:murein DD-endopeptidase MepM/ murein hydrolase activator NlpD